MTIEDNSSNRIIKRRILKPRVPADLEDQRPKMKLRELTPQENENSEHTMQTKENKDSENMKRTNFTEEYKKLIKPPLNLFSHPKPTKYPKLVVPTKTQ